MENSDSKILRQVFDVGVKCAEEHSDDDSYDNIHFERVIKKIEWRFKRKIKCPDYDAILDNCCEYHFRSFKAGVYYCTRFNE